CSVRGRPSATAEASAEASSNAIRHRRCLYRFRRDRSRIIVLFQDSDRQPDVHPTTTDVNKMLTFVDGPDELLCIHCQHSPVRWRQLTSDIVSNYHSFD